MKTKHNSLSKLEERMVKKKDFFESYFFPNLKNKYWDTNEMSEKRDKLQEGSLLTPVGRTFQLIY
jgi:hypothetical protein